VINTCSVTHEAERKSKQAVRRCIKENPEAKIIVTGCAAKTSADYFKTLNGVSALIQNEEKDNYSDLIDEECFSERARAFLQIQNGCDNHCSFCIVPTTRGPSKSLPLEIILFRIEHFLKLGFKEIVLSGINITSYGVDIEQDISLEKVIRTVLLKFPELPRLRISSIDPDGISDSLFNVFATEHKVMPHFHLSIQSGDNDILKMMKRRHSREYIIEFCQTLKLHRPDVVFGADFIAGFPGETESMFENSLTLVDDAGLSLLHVFPYSERRGTLAARFIQLPNQVRQGRAEKLRHKGQSAKQKIFQAFVGKKVSLVVEKTADGVILGKTDQFLPIRIDGYQSARKNIVDNVSVTSFDQDFLIGTMQSV
jgi:threonylcarbamoyladenosine tRNA methylthiotransferase MtaB